MSVNEMNIDMISERTEHEHQAEVVERYSEAIDHRHCLHAYGYKSSTPNIMKAQADLNMQAILTDIRDELQSIAESLRNIKDK